MAAGDMALRILVSAEAGNAIGTMSGMGGILGGIFKGLGNSIGNLVFGFQNLGTAGTVGMDAIKAGAGGLVVGLASLVALLGLVAIAAGVGIGIIAVRAAADFQQGLNRLVTGAGDTTDSMKTMGDGILAVSTQTGILTSGTDGLNAAMYQVISANQRGAQALNTLAVAGKGAQAEQANVVDVVKALTTAMTDYGTKQFNATQFMNGYTRATQLGKVTLEALSNAMGPLLPLAHSVGISFADMAAAMATMTNAGIPVNRAATSLRFLMQSLENPTHKANAAMNKWGLDSVKVADEMKVSLPGALQMIYNAALKAGPEGSVPFNRAMSDMVGGQRSLQAMLSLTGTHMKDFRGNSDKITAAMKASRDAVLGWDKAQSGFNVKMDQAKAAVQALFIKIGTVLLPVLTDIVGKVTPVIQRFADWVIKNHVVENSLALLGTVFQTVGNILTWISPLVVWLGQKLMQLISWVQQNQSVMEALKVTLIIVGGIIAAVLIVGLLAAIVTIGLVVAAIGTIVAIVWGVIQVVDFLKANWMTAWHLIVIALDQAILNILDGFRPLFELLAKLPGPVGDMARGVLKHFDDLRNGVKKNMDDTKKQVIQDAADLKIGALNHTIDLQKQAVAHFDTMRLDLIKQIKNTKDPVIKHALEMKLKTVTEMEDLHIQAVRKAEQMKQGVVAHTQQMKDQVVGHSIIPDMVNSIVQWFGQLPGRALAAVQGLLSNMAGFFSNLASQAVTWGSNIIKGVVNGILSMVGSVVDAVGKVASAIASHLPHSPVKQGPLVGLENWGGTIVTMLADGMVGNTPRMYSAARGLAGSVAAGLGLNTGFSVGLNGGNAFGLSTSGTGQPTMTITIQLDSKVLAQAVGVRMAKEVRVQAAVKR